MYIGGERKRDEVYSGKQEGKGVQVEKEKGREEHIGDKEKLKCTGGDQKEGDIHNENKEGVEIYRRKTKEEETRRWR